MASNISSRIRSTSSSVSTNPINLAGALLLLLYGYVLCQLRSRYQDTIHAVVTGKNGASLLVLVLCIIVLVFLLTSRGSRRITIAALVIGIIVGFLLSYGLIVFSTALLALLFWPLVCLVILLGLLYMTLKR